MITHRMAKLVVDALEVIDVEHDHRQVLIFALGTVQFDLDPLLEVTAVVDAGERIGDRQGAQIFFHALEVGDIRQVAMP
ncbi:hypothetical protein D3C76_1724660 [compost metagenome]